MHHSEMAVNSPGSYNFKSRHLPQPPTPQQQQQHQQQQLSDRRSPSQSSQNLGWKSPSTPRVFEFPPEHYPGTPNANYDFEVFLKSDSPSDSRSSLLPESVVTGSTSNNSDSFCQSPGYHGHQQALSPAEAKSPIFQFCDQKKKKTFVKTLSYPPKSPVSAGQVTRSRTPTSTGSLQGSFSHKSPKPMFQHAQRNSCCNLGRVRNPSSPTAMVASPSENFGSNSRGAEARSPKLSTDQFHEFSSRVDVDRSGTDLDRPAAGNPDESKRQSRKKHNLQPLQLNLQGNAGSTESGTSNIFARREHKRYQERGSPKMGSRERMGSVSLNKSHGCLMEMIGDNKPASSGFANVNSRINARKSTSDLAGLNADEAETEVAILAGPVRRGSMKGGLAYLASRRGSRDSQVSNVSNVSNEDIGPLNFNAHPRGRQRRTSNFLELPVPDHIRPRVHSLPEKAYNPRAGDDLYRLRAFSITHKGVVNRGDSIISRRSRSNTSVNSSRNSNVSGERSPFEGSCCSGQGVAADSTESDVEEIPKYRVVLLGDSGVGKTALVSQFMTSEYMNTYDASLDDEFGEKTVSILLDGEESEMVFIDHPHVEMSVENSLSTYEPHACIVVYSIVSRASFQVAEETLNYLWREHFTKDRSVIVVGNKSDLARSRKITANEGKQLATSRECKFIETSSGIQHNVDELLVGVLKQIRLRETRDKKLRRQGSKGKMLSKLHGSKTALSLNLARDILNKMCLNDSKSKSCENLHVL